MLATATEVGSLAATPITSDSCLPSLLMRPRITSGGPVLTGVVVEPGSDGVVDADVLLSISYPDAASSPNAAVVVIAGGAVGTYPGSLGERICAWASVTVLSLPAPTAASRSTSSKPRSALRTWLSASLGTFARSVSCMTRGVTIRAVRTSGMADN
ncbi:hypothetical protein LAUMK41_04210 [Mycobacterium attenuatum]|uniref:Uncharacterized protein n=1 Tax=Mycobacterium attenuatum TaxID=2341086 RepID=A0A498QAC6_9MYCO|nr:hypothetical protein LAUMK136_04094 [Mycobacterium attenuatum]VBA60809.1 hypothetical protein LAUMK41_04210 [Mycobacterium attenuatum]